MDCQTRVGKEAGVGVLAPVPVTRLEIDVVPRRRPRWRRPLAGAAALAVAVGLLASAMSVTLVPDSRPSTPSLVTHPTDHHGSPRLLAARDAGTTGLPVGQRLGRA